MGETCCLIEGAGELAEVAAEGVAPGIEVGRQGTRIVGGIIGRAAAHIHHRRPLGCQRVVGAGLDTLPAFGAEIGVLGIIGVLRAFLGGDYLAEVDPGANVGVPQKTVMLFVGVRFDG